MNDTAPMKPAAARFPLPGPDIDPKGDVRTACTIAVMAACIRSTERSGKFRRVVNRWRSMGVLPAAPRFRADLGALYLVLRNVVRFEPDPPGIEHIRHPDLMADELLSRDGLSVTTRNRFGAIAGDCDDMAVLGASILMACHYRPVLIVLADGEPPFDDRFRHVFFGAYDPSNAGPPVPLDPQEGYTPGRLPRHTRIQFWEIPPDAP